VPAGIAENSHLRKQNYFYYNCMTGHFLRDNCPSYLKEENFNRLKDGLINRLTISTCFFLDELRARKYSKVGWTMSVFVTWAVLCLGWVVAWIAQLPGLHCCLGCKVTLCSGTPLETRNVVRAAGLPQVS
jgi:hypothetical protein